MVNNIFGVLTNNLQFSSNIFTDTVSGFCEKTKKRVVDLSSFLRKPENAFRYFHGATFVIVFTESCFIGFDLERVGDLATHGACVFLPNKASKSVVVFLSVLNAGRLASMYHHGLAGSSSIPNAANFVDIANHAMSLFVLGYLAGGQEVVVKPKEN